MTPFRVIIVGACIPLAAPADYPHIQVPAHRAPAFIARQRIFHFEDTAARRYPGRGVGRKALRTCERRRGYPSTHPACPLRDTVQTVVDTYINLDLSDVANGLAALPSWGVRDGRPVREEGKDR